MAKLPRVTAKIFASNADNDDIGQFGSALNGTKVKTGDIEQIQALPAYETGWRGAVISTKNYPTLPEMNGLQKTFSQQIAYLLENGIAEYDSGTTYYEGDFCRVGNEIYYSVQDNNLNQNPVNNNTYWNIYNPVINSLMFGGILEAPNGVLTYTTTSITIKNSIKFVCPNGRNSDGTAKNLIATLSADTTRQTTDFSTFNIHYLQSNDGGQSWGLGGRNLTQWYVQEDTPSMNKGDATNATWFNPTTNIVKQTSDGGNTWTETLICPICWTRNDVSQNDKPIIAIRELNTVKFLSIQDTVITALDRPDSYAVRTNIGFQTVFYCPDDGYVVFASTVGAGSGGADSAAGVWGQINDENVYANQISNNCIGVVYSNSVGRYKVYAGDKIYYTYANWSGDPRLADWACYFIPMKREYL